MSRFRNQYPAGWRALSAAVKHEAGHRCVRCHHPFSELGKPVPCDARCDRSRGRILPRSAPCAHDYVVAGLNYGIHHLDGDKANGRWWNLLALCNSCHLTIQARVIPEQGYQWPHSVWFQPYAAGFYAHRHGGIETTRDEVVADLPRFLAMGQPHLYTAGAA